MCFFEEISIQTLGRIELPLNSILENKDDKPVVLFTWSKGWCDPCIKSLDHFNENYYKKLRSKTGMKFIALSLDQEKTNEEIKEFVIEKGWYFDVYQDTEGNFMRKLNRNSVPETFFIVNGRLKKHKYGFVEGLDNPEKTSKFIYDE